MSPRAALVVVAVLGTCGLLRAADQNLEFTGVITTGGQTRVALTDKATNATTWLEPGQDYRGFTVARYDPKEDVVFVKRGTEEIRLSLVAARTTSSSAPVAAVPVTPLPINAPAGNDATAAAVRSNLRRLVAAARQYQQQRGAANVSFAELVGPGKPISELTPVAGENYSTLSFGANVTAVSVTTANGATVTLDIPPGSAAMPPANAVAGQTAQINAVPLPPDPAAANTVAATPPIPNPTQAGLPTGLTSAPPQPGVSTTIPPAPATEPPATPPGTTIQPTDPARPMVVPSYTIQAGDTWEKISAGTGVPVQQLRAMNPGLLNGTTLPTGQAMRLRQ